MCSAALHSHHLLVRLTVNRRLSGWAVPDVLTGEGWQIVCELVFCFLVFFSSVN